MNSAVMNRVLNGGDKQFVCPLGPCYIVNYFNYLPVPGGLTYTDGVVREPTPSDGLIPSGMELMESGVP